MESRVVSGDVTEGFSLTHKEGWIGAKLNCYASGSGALSFGYTNRDGKATGDKVTLRDVKWFLKHREPELIRTGWLIGEVSSYNGYLIFQPCRRLGPDELELHSGKVVSYLHKVSDQHILVFDHEGAEIKNISIKSQVLFYLNHEQELDSIIYQGGL